MLPPMSKPRVFLSHSSLNKPFIQKVYDDLVRCQVAPWMDSIDIRHGQPWLEAIFEHGIAACDAILVYITEESLKSELVKKEIDASIIAKLKDKRVAFLPYVSSGGLRPLLRPDLQALQSPGWNEANYSVVLPQVVAELWHSYTDRVVEAATQAERLMRLEAQMELERLRKLDGRGIFRDSEEEDFAHIWLLLNRVEVFHAVRIGLPDTQETPVCCHVSMQSLVPLLSTISPNQYDGVRVARRVIRGCKTLLQDSQDVRVCSPKMFTGLKEELTMYGLLVETPKLEASWQQGPLRSTFYTIYTEKYNRFRYWLAVKKLLPQAITITIPNAEDNGAQQANPSVGQ